MDVVIEPDEFHTVTPPIRDPDYWRARHERRKARRGSKGGVMANLKLLHEGRCRLCQTTEVERRARTHRPERWWLTRHHMIPRADGGRNDPDNIVPLCRACHDLIDKKSLAKRIQHRAVLRALLSDDEVAYLVEWRGKEWLERHYPVDPNAWIGASELPETHSESSRRRENRPTHRRDCHPVFGCVYGCHYSGFGTMPR